MSSSTAIAPGSTILVTGGGGYVGSAIVHQLLSQGFKVKATTRTLSKLDLFKEKADKEFGAGKLEAVEIKDLSEPGALDSSLKDVSGVIHVASDTTFGTDLELITQGVVSMSQEVLKSSKKAGGVKSFVFTSSKIAAFLSADAPKKVDQDTWFDNAAALAKVEQDTVMKRLYVYAASKVAGEKALWRFVEEEKPSFRASSVCPDMVLGRIHNPAEGYYSTASMLLNYASGKSESLEALFPAPSVSVNVDDTAKLHVAALLDESVSNQRLWAVSEPYSAAAIEEGLKAAKPDFKESDVSRFPGVEFVKVVVEAQASIDLLQKHYGHGFKGLKESIAETLKR